MALPVIPRDVSTGAYIVPLMTIDQNNNAMIDTTRNETIWEDFYDLPFMDQQVIRNDLQSAGTLERFQ